MNIEKYCRKFLDNAIFRVYIYIYVYFLDN